VRSQGRDAKILGALTESSARRRRHRGATFVIRAERRTSERTRLRHTLHAVAAARSGLLSAGALD